MFLVSSLSGAVIIGVIPLSAFAGLFRRRTLGILITLTLSKTFLATRGEFGGGIALPLRVMIPSSELVARAWERACLYERQIFAFSLVL